MGLCKCPKKKVTTQFCFEHAANVCEHCMVTEHPRCVIQSYLKWLSNSEYDPICHLCDGQLSSGECVRLVCYDVFHIKCLNDWASKLPSNTAPAGYRCPVCAQPVFPAPNHVSPVADSLRTTLTSFPWARAGLGLPLIEERKSQAKHGEDGMADWSGSNGVAVRGEEEEDTIHRSHSTASSTAVQPPQTHRGPQPHTRSHATHGSSSSSSGSGGGGGGMEGVVAKEDTHTQNSSSILLHHHHTTTSSTTNTTTTTASSPSSSVARKGSSSSTADTTLMLNGVDVDEGENKYKRRSAVEWFSRWWRTMNRPASRHHQGFLLPGGSRRMIFLLLVLACITVLVVMSYFGRGASDDDPMLDPLNNPNIHVQGQ